MRSYLIPHLERLNSHATNSKKKRVEALEKKLVI